LCGFNMPQAFTYADITVAEDSAVKDRGHPLQLDYPLVILAACKFGIHS